MSTLDMEKTQCTHFHADRDLTPTLLASLFLVVGVLLSLYYGFVFATTMDGLPILGLMSDRQTGLTFGVGLAMIGVIFLLSGGE